MKKILSKTLAFILVMLITITSMPITNVRAEVTNTDETQTVLLELDKTSVDLSVGEEVTLTATCSVEETLVWESSDELVATVDETGKIFAVGEGSATITVKCGEVSAECVVNVAAAEEIQTVTLELDQTSIELYQGDNITLVATCSVEETLVWETSDELVATVDENGKVLAVSEGTATITVKCGEVSAVCEVNVIVVDLIVEVLESALYVGDTYQLNASVNDPSQTITYSSSNEEVASIDENGLITANKGGSTEIIVSAGNVSRLFTIYVKDNVLDTPIISVSQSAKGIKVKWSKVAGATEYEVWRKTGSSGEWEKRKTTSASSYTNNAISYGKTYYYRVKAIDNGSEIYRESEYSATVKHKVSSIDKPAEVTAKSLSYKSIKISWSRVYPAKGYEVYRATSKTGKYTKVGTISSGSTLTYTDTGLTTGTKYYYKVRAISGTKKGSFSDIKYAKPTLKAPVMSSTAYATKNTITVKWNKVTGASGYYIYRRSSSSDSWKRIATVTGGSTLSYKNTDLSSGRYYYSVRAYRTVDGEKVLGLRSDSVRLRTLGKATVTVTQYEDEFKDQVTWTKVTGAEYYKVYRKKGTNGEWKCVKTTSDTSYTSSVTHGVYYYWKVRAVYENGDTTTYGSYSSVKSFMVSYSPNYSILAMSDEFDSEAYAIGLGIQNNGSCTLRIYSKDALYISNESEDWERDLYLIDAESEDYPEISYLDIAPGETKVVIFVVCDDNPTYYSPYGYVAYQFKYDGITYTGLSSAENGHVYWQND